jgi:GTPase Era involved in 16S rRNA processing
VSGQGDPHGTAVEITRFPSGTGMVDVDATIYCEKESHKGIIIGKHGAMLKKISTMARQDMEKFMGTKVYSADLGEGQGKLARQSRAPERTISKTST